MSYSLAGVQAGQTYLIRALGNAAGDPTGGFGLEVNFGSATQPPIAPPNTVVAQQPDQGGGTSDEAMQVSTSMQGRTGMQVPANASLITIGGLTALGDMMYSMNAPDSPGSGTPGVQSLSAGATAVETTDAVAPLVGLKNRRSHTLVSVPQDWLGGREIGSCSRRRGPGGLVPSRLNAFRTSGRRRDHPWLGSDESSVGVHKRKREEVFPRQLKAIGRSIGVGLSGCPAGL